MAINRGAQLTQCDGRVISVSLCSFLRLQFPGYLINRGALVRGLSHIVLDPRPKFLNFVQVGRVGR